MSYRVKRPELESSSQEREAAKLLTDVLEKYGQTKLDGVLQRAQILAPL